MSETRKSGVERRQERLIRETREKKKIKLTAIIVVIALALLFSVAMVINSGYIRRHSVAVSAGSLKFSPAEFDYFFNSAYSQYQNMIYQNFGDSASSYLPSGDRPLKSQLRDAETGETWADTFTDAALHEITELAVFYDAAQAEGFKLSDEKRAEMDEEFNEIRSQAEMYGYSSVTEFLQLWYGANIDESAMRRLSELLYTAESYKEHIRESLSYTDEENAAYYDENKDLLDTFSYRYFFITMESVVEADYETTEEYEQAKADAIAATVAQGNEIVAGIVSEQDFIDAARAFNAESYAEDNSTLRHYKGELLGDSQGPWLRDPERKNGDVAAIEFSNGCYVQYFIDRSSNDYSLVNLRQLVITPETVSTEDYPEGVDDVGYTAAVAAAKSAARDEAELVLAALIEGGATEEKFIELIAEYSDDTTVEDGLYENVYRYETESRLAAEVNEWPFEQVREVGDYVLIEAEDGTQYIVFLSSYGEQYNWYLADTGMRDRDYKTWDESLVRPETKKHWAFSLTSG